MINITVIDNAGKEIFRAAYPEAIDSKRIEDVIYEAIGDTISAIKKIVSPAPVNSYAAKSHEVAKQVNGSSDWSGDLQINFQVNSYQAPDHHKEQIGEK
ncbi:MAG: hypothetical protein HQK99_02450 [Nitrospirae bacterium]|nr:hypothetical protein [Nitrospirota bacterium]